ncbi:MAG: DUF4157 domain-containing protein [Ilumatobacteraceae bacterium]
MGVFVGDHQLKSTMSVGSAKDPAEKEADRVANAVVRHVAAVRPPEREISLADGGEWASDLILRSFNPTGTGTGMGSSRIRRAEVSRARLAPGSLARTAATASRIRRSNSPVSGSASGPAGGPLDADTAGRIQRASGRGAPIDTSIRPSLESAFAADFGAVNIHANSPLPAEVGAIAFTHGNDVHFAPGQYQPETATGLHTLSHELTHVVQQGGAAPTELHRLMSATQFKDSAKESFYQVHGKTMSEIDLQLVSYDALKAKGGHLDIGANGIDRAVNILAHIQEDIAFWMKSHSQDKGRQKQRQALDGLKLQVDAEVIEMMGYRDAFQDIGVTGDLKKNGNTFVQKMEGSASSILDKLSPIISAAIPAPGDGAKLELTVKIPVDPSTAGYVGFTIGLGLQRGDRSTTKISMKAAVNGGAQIMGVADVGGELGAFIEAQGKDPKAALQLISWGWYRRFRESILPREVASFMWGGSTGAVGWARSETWAANVEKNNLSEYGGEEDDTTKSDSANAKANSMYHPEGGRKDLTSGVGSKSTTNAYVRTGAYGSATASGTVGGIATMEGGVTATGGTHYDRKTVTDRKAKRGTALGEAEAMPTRGKTTYLGTRFMKLEAALGVSVGPFSGSLGGALEFLTDQEPSKKNPKKKKGMKLEYLSGSFSAGATVPLGGKLADGLANGIVKLAPMAINLVKMLAAKAKDDDESGAPEGAGELVAQGEAMATAFGAFPQDSFSFTDFSIGDDPMASLGDQLKTGASVGESASTISISIAIGKNLWDRSAPVSVDITLNSEQGIQLDASIVSLTATRSRRLLRFKFTGGTWKPEVD